VAGHFAFFGIQPASYFANAASGRFVEIKQGGWARLDAKSLVLLKPSAKKAIHGITDVVFLPLKSLPPIPPCE
jgi:SpoU rRNA methylase family enzyme